MQVKDIIDKLRSTNSSLEKIAILKANEDNDILKKVLFFTYNPRYKYYIRDIPEYHNGSCMVSLDLAVDNLLDLQKRNFTGNDAIRYLRNILENCENPEIIELIIDGDIKAGVNVSIINKVFKDLIPEEPYQGCLPFNEKAAKELFENSNSICSQIKADGQYVNALVLDNIELKARSGELQYFNGKIIDSLKKLDIKNAVINGEFTINGYDRNTANGILRSIISINEKIHKNIDVNKELQKFIKEHKHGIEYFEDNILYIVWDIIPYDEYLVGLSTSIYSDRFEFFASLIKDIDNIKLVESLQVKEYKDAINHFKEALSSGEEGTVLKDMNALWQDGKHKHQLKMKLIMDLDLEIIGFNEGTKGTKFEGTLGSLIVGTSDRKIISSCGGLKEKSGIRDEIWNNQDKYLGKISSVKCNGISSNRQGGYGLLYPSYNEVRDDKFEADSFDDCMKIQEMKCQLQ